jgi:hypothetical protein
MGSLVGQIKIGKSPSQNKNPHPAHITLRIYHVSIVKIWSDALALQVVKWISSLTSLKMHFIAAWTTGIMSNEDMQKLVSARGVRTIFWRAQKMVLWNLCILVKYMQHTQIWDLGMDVIFLIFDLCF